MHLLYYVYKNINFKYQVYSFGSLRDISNERVSDGFIEIDSLAMLFKLIRHIYIYILIGSCRAFLYVSALPMGSGYTNLIYI